MSCTNVNNSGYLEEMRIILLGRTGQGKSALGNSICGSQERNWPFESGISSSSITQISKPAYRTYYDRKLCVIDTPGLFGTNRSNEETMKQFTVALQEAKPGPHAFLIVLSGRCTNEEISVLDLLKKNFGEYFLDYCFLIITREDEIREDDTQSSDDQILEKYFQEAPVILNEFRIKCSRRCFLINNRASFAEREQKISILINMIKQNEDTHANSFYNQEMFDYAERYDREWNNAQFDDEQTYVKMKFEIINERQYWLEEVGSVINSS